MMQKFGRFCTVRGLEDGPTGQQSVNRSRRDGGRNGFRCTINEAKQGTYYVLIKGYTADFGTTYTMSSGQ
ncbi:hypothetical protein [Archangium sp.]|jgi:hypothetical protein|uniref:hypothetical protein n=1 Tax=Archangium sp. TaxID=1872627 RepID=UPI002ED8861D